MLVFELLVAPLDSVWVFTKPITRPRVIVGPKDNHDPVVDLLVLRMLYIVQSADFCIWKIPAMCNMKIESITIVQLCKALQAGELRDAATWVMLVDRSIPYCFNWCLGKAARQ